MSDEEQESQREVRLRKTSRVKEGKTPFPFDSPLVPFVFVFPDRVFQATKVDIKISHLLLSKDYPDALVLAPWPGKDRQDCFVIDDVDEALEALGYHVERSESEPAGPAQLGAEVRGPGDALLSAAPGEPAGDHVQLKDSAQVVEGQGS